MQHTNPLLIELPMPIRTPRLLLRPGQLGDGAGLLEAKRESWPEVSRWMDWASGPVDAITERGEEAFARRKAAEFILRSEIWLPVFSRDGGRLLGAAGYHAIDWQGRLFSTGYWVRTGETGKGLATELLGALVRYAFGALAANRLAVSHAEGNGPSQRVIEKLGFEKEGITRRFYLLNGVLVDSRHYARFDCQGLPELDVSWG